MAPGQRPLVHPGAGRISLDLISPSSIETTSTGCQSDELTLVCHWRHRFCLSVEANPSGPVDTTRTGVECYRTPVLLLGRRLPDRLGDRKSRYRARPQRHASSVRADALVEPYRMGADDLLERAEYLGDVEASPQHLRREHCDRVRSRTATEILDPTFAVTQGFGPSKGDRRLPSRELAGTAVRGRYFANSRSSNDGAKVDLSATTCSLEIRSSSQTDPVELPGVFGALDGPHVSRFDRHSCPKRV